MILPKFAKINQNLSANIHEINIAKLYNVHKKRSARFLYVLTAQIICISYSPKTLHGLILLPRSS